MNNVAPISVPIALCGFLLFIDGVQLFDKFTLHHYPWQNQHSIRSRLQQLGKSSLRDYENFRISQMSLFLLSWLLPLTLYFTSLLSFRTMLIFCLLLGLSVVLITERNLTLRCKRRRELIESEFPAIVEMLTLAIGAGESPASAFRRIALRANGSFAVHIRKVVHDVERGSSFTTALDAMGRELESDSVRLFTDSMVIAISRGSSLIETMEHAVQQSRNQARVHLISAASKSEISMLIPVVFLILPISILFALYPSLTNLNLFAS